jgi:integrase
MTCGTFTPQPCCSPASPVHVVAARLGHADPAITLRVYAHVIRSAEAAAADIFAQAVKAA